jgi:CRISPR-associated protein Cpf1
MKIALSLPIYGGKKWTVCSSVERYRWDRKKNAGRGGYDVYPKSGEGSIIDKLTVLLQENSIDTTRDILPQLKKLAAEEHVQLWKSILFYFSLICQIRNTDAAAKADKQDFILSPVEPFFDSRNAKEGMPQNGDENGAYNIARKGQIILDKISSWSDEPANTRKKYPDIFVSNEEWDKHITR